jgi:hypothetical protein
MQARTQVQLCQLAYCPKQVMLQTSNTPPQAGCNSSEFAKCFALMLSKAFVSMSAVMSSVGQYTKLIVLFCTMN